MTRTCASPSTLAKVIPVSETPCSPSSYVSGLISVLQQLPTETMSLIIDRLIAAYDQGRAVYLFGNGGSAALASHATCDLGKGTAVNGNRRFRVMALTDNIPLMTAWANDSRYEDIFAEQLRNFIAPGDISFAISGSGNSPNVLNALALSRDLGGTNIGLTGFEGGKMKQLCDLCLVVPSDNMQHIEDAHVAISHSVFLAIRDHITSGQGTAVAAARASRSSGNGNR